MAPKRYAYILTLRIYAYDLIGEKGLCRWNYVKDLKTRSSWITQVGTKSNDRYPYKRREEEKADTPGRRTRGDGRRGWSDAVLSQGKLVAT